MIRKKDAVVFPTILERFAASLIDSSMVFLFAPLSYIVASATFKTDIFEEIDFSVSELFIKSSILTVLFMWIYTVSMECSQKEATLGKIVLRMKVVDHRGARLKPLQSSIRYFSFLLTLLFAGLPFIASLGGRGQTYLEQWNKTLVVREKATVADIRNKRIISSTGEYFLSILLISIFSFFIVKSADPFFSYINKSIKIIELKSQTKEIVKSVLGYHFFNRKWPSKLSDVDPRWDSNTIKLRTNAKVVYHPGKMVYTIRLDDEVESIEVNLIGLINPCDPYNLKRERECVSAGD